MMTQSKKELREELERARKEFLKQGGEIQKLKPGKAKGTDKQKVGSKYAVASVGRKSVTLGRI